jgi:hypothetical protein
MLVDGLVGLVGGRALIVFVRRVPLPSGVVICNLTEGGQMLGVIESPDGRSNFLDGIGAFANDDDACQVLTAACRLSR